MVWVSSSGYQRVVWISSSGGFVTDVGMGQVVQRQRGFLVLILDFGFWILDFGFWILILILDLDFDMDFG